MVKDVNPQLFRMAVVESAVGTYTEAQFNTNISNVPQGNSIMVMEILKIFLEFGVDNNVEDSSYRVHVADRSHSAVQSWNTPGIIARSTIETQVVTSGGMANQTPKVIDLSDGNGNGLLYARSTIFLACIGVTQTAAGGAQASILYRWKKIPVTEYIGIVES